MELPGDDIIVLEYGSTEVLSAVRLLLLAVSVHNTLSLGVIARGDQGVLVARSHQVAVLGEDEVPGVVAVRLALDAVLHVFRQADVTGAVRGGHVVAVTVREGESHVVVKEGRDVLS